MALGLSLLALFAAGPVATGCRSDHAPNGSGHKDFDALLSEAAHARAAHPGWIPDALRELQRQCLSGHLSPDQIHRIARIAIDKQNSLEFRPYPDLIEAHRWIDILDRFEWTNLLSAEDREQYMRQIALFELKVRPKVHRGYDIPARLRLGTRFSKGTGRWIYHAFHVSRCRIGDHVVRVEFDPKETEGPFGVIPQEYEHFLSSSGIEPGRYQVEYTVDYSLHLINSVIRGDDPETVLGQWDYQTTYTLTSPVEILREGAPPTVVPVSDPAVKARFQRALFLESADVFARSAPGPDGRPQPVAMIRCRMRQRTPLPCGVACDVFARIGRSWRKIARWVRPKGAEPVWHEPTFFFMTRSMDADRIELAFRPNRRLAEESLDVFDFFDEELTFGPIDLTVEENIRSWLESGS